MCPLCTLLFCLFVAIMPTLAGQPCSPDHQLCSPEGATSYQSPVNWSSNSTILADFYEDLVDSVNRQPSKRHEPADSFGSRASIVNLCCTTNTQCLLLENFLVPFCWDRFTTNYFLPDDSYGNVASGNYTLALGVMNLITGNYTKFPSQSGNIYSDEPLAKPNTSTLPMPTPWTSSGIGTAIPASAIGETSNDTMYSIVVPQTTPATPTSTPATTTSIPKVASQTIVPTDANTAGSTSSSLSAGLLFLALVTSLL